MMNIYESRNENHDFSNFKGRMREETMYNKKIKLKM